MAQSLNTKVDLTISGTSYMGLSSYGKIIIGDKAFEFYNDRNVEDYIQIPWEEIDYISASVILWGKRISRFAIFTKENGYFTFSTRDNKKTLRAVNQYIESNRLLRSMSFIQVVKRGIQSIFKRNK